MRSSTPPGRPPAKEAAPLGPGVTAPDPPRPSYARVLAHRPFALLWVAQLVSQSGDFVFDVALIWLVLVSTGSVFAVSLVVTAAIAPGVVLGPFLGVYVDRWNRRRVLVGTNLAEGAVVAVLALALLGHAVGLSALVAVVVALAAAGSLVRSATNALVPQLVGTADLPPANSLFSLSGSFNQVLGLTVGGIVVGLLGPRIPIDYDAGTFVVAALLVARIPLAAGAVAARPAGAPDFRAELAEGFRYLATQRALLELIAIGVVVNFFGNGIFALFAPYARLVLHGSAATYGFLGAAIAAGAIVGAYAIGRVETRRSAGRYLFGGGLGVGAGVVGLGLAGVVPVALAVAAGIGVALSVTNIPISVLLQAKVPGRLLGRVGSAFGALIQAAGPLGAFLSGAIATRTSIPTFYVISGAVIVAMMAIGYGAMRDLRTVAY